MRFLLVCILLMLLTTWLTLCAQKVGPPPKSTLPDVLQGKTPEQLKQEHEEVDQLLLNVTFMMRAT